LNLIPSMVPVLGSVATLLRYIALRHCCLRAGVFRFLLRYSNYFDQNVLFSLD
jgi:hypothetical protein